MNYTREQLYDLVWSKSLNAVATECQVSTPVLRQFCMDQAIPLPWGGYRPNRITSERPMLPAKEDGFDYPAAIAKAVNGLHFPGEITMSFQIQKKLTDPDSYIVAAQNTIKEDYQFHNMSHMFRTGFGELVIRSSKSNMDRALCIMDALVN
jgi:hypothetical protein